MAYPRTKGTDRGNKARQPRAGIALNKTISEDKVKELLKQEHGNISRCADIIGTCRGTLSRMIDASQDLKECLRQCRERQLDQLERSCFDRAIETNDTTLQLFLLKTQGRSRGYDQDESKAQAKEIANAAFEFILAKSK